jgi:hypothetical protein
MYRMSMSQGIMDKLAAKTGQKIDKDPKPLHNDSGT